MASDIHALYEQAASDWQRSEPLLLSDFTARERVFEAVGDICGLHIWDLGCGEGYVSRRLAALGARQVEGFDLSAAMVEAAQLQANGQKEAQQATTLHYRVADLADPEQLPNGTCDAALAVFLFNYLPLAASQRQKHRYSSPANQEQLVALIPGRDYSLASGHASLPHTALERLMRSVAHSREEGEVTNFQQIHHFHWPIHPLKCQ